MVGFGLQCWVNCDIGPTSIKTFAFEDEVLVIMQPANDALTLVACANHQVEATSSADMQSTPVVRKSPLQQQHRSNVQLNCPEDATLNSRHPPAP
eukprot:304705-Amphidinium_carterae.1